MTTYAEFARTKGAKDKKKRRSRGGMIAGGAAGAGALAGGIRYGGSELAMRRGRTTTGAAGLASSDLARIREGLGNSKANQARKGLQSAVAGSTLGRKASSVVERAKNSAGRAANAARRGSIAIEDIIEGSVPKKGIRGFFGGRDKTRVSKGMEYFNAPNPAREALERGKNVWKSGAVGKAGILGAGALGAGATAAGVMAYLNAKKKAKKSKSLRGRISSAMGRK